jgi:hypothetical protein
VNRHELFKASLLIRMWFISVLGAYAGVFLVTIRECDSHIDKYALSPTSSLLLVVFDPLAALLSGTVLLAISWSGLAIVRALPRSPLDTIAARFGVILPLPLIALIVASILLFADPTQATCRAI